MTAFFVVAAYIVITTGVGWYLSNRAKSSNDTKSFFLAKKNLGPILICFLMFGEMVAGSSTVGSATTAFNSGLSSVWTNWGQALGVLVFVFTVSKFYRVASHNGAYSVPEAFEFRFDHRTRLVVMVIVMVVYGIMFAMQPRAAAAVLAPMINVDITVMSWVMACIFIIQALVGLRGIAGMNIVHASVLYAGVGIVAFLAFHEVGGLAPISQTLPEHFLRVDYPNVQSMIGTAVGSMFGFILSSTLVANVYGAKSKKAANTGVSVAAVLVIIFALFPAFVGVAGRYLMPDAAPGTILYSVAGRYGDVVGGIASMAIIAAVFSTGPAFLLTLSTTLTRDFYVALIKPDADDKAQLRFSKLAIVGIGLVATFLGLNATSILSQVSGAFQIRSVAGVVLIISVYWKKVDKRAAFWSILVGGIVAAVWHFSGQPFGIVPFWPGNIVGVAILLILTLTNGYSESPDYTAYREHMEAIPPEEL